MPMGDERAAPPLPVRRARSGDGSEVARLIGELGYVSTDAQIAARLARLLDDARHYVAVIEAEDGRLAALVHAEHRDSLEHGERAELVGLVVDAKIQRAGLGRRLVAAAAQWAAARGLADLTVRSNIARPGAHVFYQRLGFTRTKTQHVYARSDMETFEERVQ
jgi:GNAT superfamily N-acetyltransferase